MSEKARDSIGVILILISLTICLICSAKKNCGADIRFDSGEKLDSGIDCIATEKNGSIRVNDAGTAELTELPGIGGILAEQIIAERNRNGLYYYAEDLESVKGIGSKTIEKIREMIDLTQGESGE